jgi:heme-binding protein
MRRRTKIAALVVGIAFVAIQFVPAHRTNRLGTGDPDAPRDVQWVLRRACYDCHSTETRWPIWAYVAPMSWRVVADVDRARERLNFSDWTVYDRDRRVALRALSGPLTATHRMPLWYYVTLHPDARLSEADVALLQAWSGGASGEAR